VDTDAPGLGELLGHVAFDPPWLVAIALAAWWYMWTVRRVNARRPRHPVPGWRVAAFMGGLAAVWLAVLGPVEYWGNTLLWVNFLGFLLLTMIAAPLFVLSSPLTLAFRAGSPATRRRLRRLYRSPPAGVLTFPVFTWLAFAVLTYAWQFTILTEHAAANAYVRDLQLLSLFAVSLLFWMPAFAVDPLRWRLNHPLRFLYIMLEMVHKGLFGGMFLSLNTPFHETLAAGLPAWGPSPMTDQRMAILVLWIGGNLIFLLALVFVIHGWLGFEDRNTHRIDRRLEKERAARRQHTTALDQVFQKSV
jgi:cytochrome c oxidase assembly factor CtaG